MTNQVIINDVRKQLLAENKIKLTSRRMPVTVENRTLMIYEPEEIHTFQKWHELGFKVKKGEKAIAKFRIWKYVSDKKADNEEIDVKADIDDIGHCILKDAYFFAEHQVEEVK